MELHRLEVVAHGDNGRTEYWRNADGTLRLHRSKRSNTWRVTLDGILVQRGEALLVAPRAEEAAMRLAMAENVHCVFDYGQEWEQDVAGQPLRIRPRPS